MAASIATVARAAPIDSIAASIARPSRVPRARRAAATLGGVLVAQHLVRQDAGFQQLGRVHGLREGRKGGQDRPGRNETGGSAKK